MRQFDVCIFYSAGKCSVAGDGMDAAVLWAPGEKYKIETVVVAAPKKNQVRVQILYASICHTDVTMSQMKAIAPMFPVILGHEAAGVVESVGEGVTDIKAGDYVLPFMQGECGDCSFCKHRRSNVCRELPMKMISRNLPAAEEPHLTTEDGKVISVFLGISAFSEYTVIHKASVVKLSSEAALEKICVLSCGVGTGIGAVWKVAKVWPGSTVAVFGLGTIGLAVVQACKVAGASRIIGVDTNPRKFEKAKELGLTDFINSKDHQDKSLSTVITELNGGGVDFSFECVGIPKLMSEAVGCTAGDIGLTVILGVCGSRSEEFQVNAFNFVRGKTAMGSVLGGLRVRDLPDIVERCMSEEFQLGPYITHRLPFSQFDEAMEIVKSGDCLRCVLQMGV